MCFLLEDRVARSLRPRQSAAGPRMLALAECSANVGGLEA
jgi:hypothetical protein